MDEAIERVTCRPVRVRGTCARCPNGHACLAAGGCRLAPTPGRPAPSLIRPAAEQYAQEFWDAVFGFGPQPEGD
jgi:hypothetical protein